MVRQKGMGCVLWMTYANARITLYYWMIVIRRAIRVSEAWLIPIAYRLSMHCPYSPFQVYKLYINRRDWERTNYETDIRYIEHILNSGFLNEKAKTRFVLECDCRSMSLFYIRQTFFRRLMSSLRARYKNRLVKVYLSGSGKLWALISYWLVRDAIPLSVQDKIEWGWNRVSTLTTSTTNVNPF